MTLFCFEVKTNLTSDTEHKYQFRIGQINHLLVGKNFLLCNAKELLIDEYIKSINKPTQGPLGVLIELLLSMLKSFFLLKYSNFKLRKKVKYFDD